jgi:hypothetical protein
MTSYYVSWPVASIYNSQKEVGAKTLDCGLCDLGSYVLSSSHLKYGDRTLESGLWALGSALLSSSRDKQLNF